MGKHSKFHVSSQAHELPAYQISIIQIEPFCDHKKLIWDKWTSILSLKYVTFTFQKILG